MSSLCRKRSVSGPGGRGRRSGSRSRRCASLPSILPHTGLRMTLRALKPGDTVALVSPASPLEADKLAAVTAILEGEGYRRPRLAPRLGRDGLPRRARTRTAPPTSWRRSTIPRWTPCSARAAATAARGSFPSSTSTGWRRAGSRCIGFSDVTTLHLALNRRGLATVHAPMALTLHYPRPEWVYESFRRVLRGDYAAPEDAPRGETLVPGDRGGRGHGRVPVPAVPTPSERRTPWRREGRSC